MENININFLPVTNSDFDFNVYRKAVGDTSHKSSTGNRQRLRDKITGDYVSYDVAWDTRDSFEAYSCFSKENYSLTNQYLIKLLLDKLESENSGVDYYIPEKSFYREIIFVLQKYSQGQSEIRLIPYFLDSHKQFGFLILHQFKMASQQAFNREVQRLSLSLDSRYQQNTSYYSDKFKVVETFIRDFIPKFQNLTNGVRISTELVDTPVDELDTKTYLVGNSQESNSQYLGIKKSGPFKNMDGKVKYLFVFTESTRQLARDVYSGLDGKLFPGMFSGLNAMFKLPFGKDTVEHLIIDSYQDSNINTISNNAVGLMNNGEYKVCVITFLPSNLSEEENKSVYSHIKLKSIESGFYTQSIRQDTMGRKEQLKWSIGNIGLQIFSKLGGIPWIMKPSHKNCLIFGIGSAHEEDADNKITKYTAYTVCIDTKGNFRSVKPLSSSIDKKEYLSNLEVELGELIGNEQLDIDECVIHVPFKVRRDEINAIQSVVNRVRGNVSFEIKILKINTKHKFFGFSFHNTKVPYESTMVQLSKKEYLVWTEGLQYGKSTVSRRVSEPLHIEFLYGGNGDYDEDKAYLQDVINLTGANWRGFNSKAQPISIYYSQLIASFMKRFGKYESIADFSALSKESFNPWFL